VEPILLGHWVASGRFSDSAHCCLQERGASYQEIASALGRTAPGVRYQLDPQARDAIRAYAADRYRELQGAAQGEG
jgi:hypothetical protein